MEGLLAGVEWQLMILRVGSNCKVKPGKGMRTCRDWRCDKEGQQQLQHVFECEMSEVVGVIREREREREGMQASQIGLLQYAEGSFHD